MLFNFVVDLTESTEIIPKARSSLIYILTSTRHLLERIEKQREMTLCVKLNPYPFELKMQEKLSSFTIMGFKIWVKSIEDGNRLLAIFKSCHCNIEVNL